jgi:hypothetical protein
MKQAIYNYCTDFVINLANLTGLSYFEVNLLVFLIIYPALLLACLFLFIIQIKRVKRLQEFSRIPS